MTKKSESDVIKGVEQELQEQIDLTRTITENLGEGVCVLDENGRITFLNKAATDILGWTRADLLGELLREPIFTHDAQGRPLSSDQHPLQPVIRENAIIHDAEAIFSGRNARRIPVSYTAAPIRNANDELSALVAFRDISERKAIEAELTELRRRLARSREHQRTHLAQELHDGPLQDLYAARYQLQAIKNTTKHNQQLQRQLGLMEQLFQQISDTLRAISNELRPPTLVPFGLEAAIRSHVETVRQLYPDLTVTLDLMADEQTLPEYIRLTLYRIYQEMMSNIVKHARATQLLIRFQLEEESLLLQIEDNGCGFEVPDRWIDLVRQGHLGLAGAAERAEEINGHFLILSTPGAGTIVQIRAPLLASEPYPVKKS